MITSAAHLAQAEHNETFFRQLRSGQVTAMDWQVTLLFCAALHYADAYLHQLQPPVGDHPTGHRQRLLNVETCLGLSLSADYRMLKEASEAARYDGQSFTDAEIESLQTAEFARIRAHVRTALAPSQEEAIMLSPAIIRELEGIVGRAHVHGAPAQLIAYSYDGTFQQHVPDLAVTPRTTDEVQRIVQIAARERIPIIPRGAGTSLAGGTIPLTGGIVLSLARMNTIKEIDAANTCAVVEPGVVTADLQRAVEQIGLFYPPDPASLNQSTLGGNVACNSGGPRCLKYGTTKDYVLGLTVVLADGRIMKCGGKVVKDATGYQLAQLFVGSEGTLGIVTEIILKLLPLPRHRSTAAAIFPDIDMASQTITAIMTAGILPGTIELLDNTSINVAEDYLNMGLPREAGGLLVLEQDGGDADAVRKDVERMAAIARAQGASDVRVAATPEERDQLWRARRAVSAALGRVRPNKLGEDIVVPRAQVPEMVRRVRQVQDAVGLPVPVFGHAGDGNLHPNILFDRRIPGELERVERAADGIFRAALALGGTLSGEHGIGSLKREYLEDAMGPVAVSVMAAIKQALDPQGILNPQKMFPQRPGDHSGFLTALPSLEGITPG